MVERTVLSDLGPEIVLLCSFCGRLRNSVGKWEVADSFIKKYPYTALSHGMCPECAAIQFPQEYENICRERKNRQTNISIRTNTSAG
jgi:hypothetical protein